MLYVLIYGDLINFYLVVVGYEEEMGVGVGDGFNFNLLMLYGVLELVFFEWFDDVLCVFDWF